MEQIPQLSPGPFVPAFHPPTLELTKYNLDEATISAAPVIHQWAFFFLRADRYEAARLRELLRGEEFQRAIAVVETIAAQTEDRQMYDQREKAQRDHQWALDSVREEGRQLGRKEGLMGTIQLLQQLLGAPPWEMEELGKRSFDELTALQAELQQRLRRRANL